MALFRERGEEKLSLDSEGACSKAGSTNSVGRGDGNRMVTSHHD